MSAGVRAAARKFLKDLSLKIPQIRRVHEHLLAANQQVAQLKLAHEQLRERAGAEQGKLSFELQDLQRQVRSARTEIALQCTRAQQQSDLASASRAERDAMASEVVDLRSRLSTVLLQFEQVNRVQQTASLEQEGRIAAEAARNKEFSRLLLGERARGAMLAADLELLQRKLVVGQGEAAELKQERMALRDTIRALKEDQSALEARIADDEVARSERDQALMKAEELTKKANDLELTTETLGRRLREAAAQLEAERGRVAHLESLSDQQRIELENAAAFRKQVEETTAQLEAERRRVAHLESLSDQQRIELENVAAVRKEAEEAAGLQLRETQMQVEQARRRVAELEATSAQRYIELINEINAARDQAATAQARAAELEAVVDQRRTELQAVEATHAKLQAEIDQLNLTLKVQSPELLARILGKLSQVEATFDRERASPAVARVAGPMDEFGIANLRERYLDLLEGTLTGTLYEDAPISPWSRGYDPEVRSLGRDWPSHALTMIGSTRMRNIRRVLEDVLAREVPGDFIETGVWRGGACIYARGILAAHGSRDRKVWVADSFEGLPPPSPDIYPADRDDPHHTFEPLRVSYKQVKQNFRDYGLLDDQVQFLKGWFSETLARAPIERLAVLRLDGDMYESTIQALEALYRKVSAGGYIIVDDYCLDPCRQAVDDYRARVGIEDSILEIDGAAVYWRKTGTALESTGDRKLTPVPKQA